MAIQGSSYLPQGTGIRIQGSSKQVQNTIPVGVAQPAKLIYGIQPAAGSPQRAVYGMSAGGGAYTGGGGGSYSAATGGGGGGGYAAPAAPQPDHEAVAYWNDAISSLQRLLSSTNVQKEQGLAGLANSYNRNLGDLNEQESTALRNYGIKRDDTQKGRQTSLRQIDTSARQGNEGLRRLFQLAGAAGSSAATMVAPNAVARDASTKRSGALETFGRNLRDIDLAEGDAKAGFVRGRRDLDSQKREKEQSFIEGILNMQNDLQSKLSNAVTQKGIANGGTYSGLAGARAQYQGAINQNQNQLNNLFNQYRDPQFNVKPVEVRTPNLAQYTVDPTTIDLAQQNPGIPEELLPYLPALRDEEIGLRGLLG